MDATPSTATATRRAGRAPRVIGVLRGDAGGLRGDAGGLRGDPGAVILGRNHAHGRGCIDAHNSGWQHQGVKEADDAGRELELRQNPAAPAQRARAAVDGHAAYDARSSRRAVDGAYNIYNRSSRRAEDSGIKAWTAAATTVP